MARRTRTRRLLGTIGITALATGATLITAPPPQAEAQEQAQAVSVWQPNSGANQRWKVTDVTAGRPGSAG
ncbi:hypothetical protein ACI2L4_23440 [Streptomyces sparsogenes]|uniref:hypothetical protein n=1 Tax=Streptomyces sparsogenes TaxID=67365 RepID=UPI0033C06D25